MVFGLGIGAFGVLGFVNRLDMFSTTGRPVLGLSSNGLLSTISVVVAVDPHRRGPARRAARLHRAGRRRRGLRGVRAGEHPGAGHAAEPAGVPHPERRVQLRRRRAAAVPRRLGPVHRAPARRQPLPAGTPPRRRGPDAAARPPSAIPTTSPRPASSPRPSAPSPSTPPRPMWPPGSTPCATSASPRSACSGGGRATPDAPAARAPDAGHPARPPESVWDYPRPPRAEPDDRRAVLRHGGVVVADTTDLVRILETSHPPTFYLPRTRVRRLPAPRPGGRRCASGRASPATSTSSSRCPPRCATSAGGTPEPDARYPQLRDRVAVYAGPFDEITLDGERVTPQPGGFYGGWITARDRRPGQGRPRHLGLVTGGSRHPPARRARG